MMEARVLDYCIVIPARIGSTRLPRKPLLDLGGSPLIAHVYRNALKCQAREVVIATDDAEIAEVAQRFGAQVAMTATTHRSGSERIAEVITQRGWSDDTCIVNLQGDEPCLSPRLLDQVATLLMEDASLNVATLASPIDDQDTLFDPNVVKVVTNAQQDALYFSRAPIPWHRDTAPAAELGWRHIGLYAYRAGFLQRYVQWPPSPLEQAESLEQLRILWQGERIRVACAEVLPGPGVDTAQDLAAVLTYLGVQ